MERKNCPGCKTHFEQGTLLPPEGISIELKNYPIPIKDPSHKLKLLKTIISFLNSKGGTIYIGAVDETREVVGVVTQRKQQDNFRIFIQQLTDRIQPKVDLTDKQDIIVQFVPVVNKGKFTGKHLIKVIVKQGDPSQQYCFTKKIQLQAVNDKKVDEYEIVYSYIRLNSGNLKELKGYELVQEVKAKAAKPHAEYNCFHDECNPQPLCMTVDILKIGFSNIFESQTREILQQWFQIYLTQLNIICPISYDQQNKMIVVQFQTKTQITKAEDFITSHLKQLNENLDGICHFDKKDKFLDCIIFQNTLKNQKIEEKKVEEPRTKINKREKVEKGNKTEKMDITEQKSQIKREKKTEAEETKYVYETAGKSEELSKNVKDNEKKDKKNEIASNKQIIQQKSSRKTETSKKQEGSQKKKQVSMVQKNEKQTFQQNEQNKNYSKKHSFTFTHINPNARNELRNYLDSLCKCKKNFEVYKNTIEVFLPNQDKYEQFYYNVIDKLAQISRFGFKDQIKFGANLGVIDIMNYDKTKSKAIIGYLKNLIGKQLRQIEPYIQGNRHIVRLGLSKSAACIWLDKLLENKEIKNFSIPGSEKNQKPKMKIFLVCQDPGEDEVYEFGMF